MTRPPIPDFDETRAGFRSGEGTDSVMRALMASAHRKQKRKNEVPDSSRGTIGSDDGDGRGGIDIVLPP